MVVKKSKIARRFGEDIWGTIIAKGKGFVQDFLVSKRIRVNPYHAYRIDIGKPRQRRRYLSQFGKILYSRIKISLFYGGLKKYKFKIFAKQAAVKRGNFRNRMSSIMERRLRVVVYRMNFAASMEESRDFIRLGYVMVNKEIILFPDKLINVGDVIDIIDDKKEFVFRKLIDRIYMHRLWVVPRYIEVNYSILSGLYYREPTFIDIMYPFKVDKRVFDANYFGKIK
jgi:small subunit ribosomal protein S4